jgi:glycosyltransferase involved in cell wall biosynthesis
MKILMVNKFLYPRGGAETYFLKIGKWLEDNGNEVQYFGMYDDKNIVSNELDIATKTMDFEKISLKSVTYPFKIIYSQEAKRKITKLCKSYKPDVVHLNNINFQLTPSIIDAVHSLGIPMVQTVHDSQMVCPNHKLLRPESTECCKKCLDGSKWNCTRYKCIHNSRVKSCIGSIEAELYKHLITYSYVNKYICPSHFMEKILLSDERFTGKTTVLHNFVEKADDYSGEKQDYVLYFGRLSQEKGTDLLLKVCELLPNIHFVIAGSGPDERKVIENSSRNVEFVGFKTGKELRNLISQARLTIYPSIWSENCPMSVLESISYGTPVITNSIGGTTELIDNGKTGTLVEKSDPALYADIINELFYKENLLDVMAENCRNSSNFITLDQYCSKLLKIYNEVNGRLT